MNKILLRGVRQDFFFLLRRLPQEWHLFAE